MLLSSLVRRTVLESSDCCSLSCLRPLQWVSLCVGLDDETAMQLCDD
jgi:hypothetical protein